VITQFFIVFKDYLIEVLPFLAIGFLLSGLIHEYSTLAGTTLPICCFGYLFSLIFGLLMYICSTASIPLVHAFIAQEMNIGAGMVLLLVGPVTSW